MTTFAVGDVHGCFPALRALLKTMGFKSSADRLLLTGDVVNRGPDSLGLLRWLIDQGDNVVSVLGNHDIHLLMVNENFKRQHGDDNLGDILDAPDADDLCAWLRHRPLVHAENGILMVHAGLLPQWTVAEAGELAREVEERLRSDDYRGFLKTLYGDEPDSWDESLTGDDRSRVIVNAMTRMRACTPDGRMVLHGSSNPNRLPDGSVRWFDAPERRSADTPIVFGHWAALGLQMRADLMAIDSGCVWGGRLTGVRLEDRRVFQVEKTNGEWRPAADRAVKGFASALG